MDLNFDYSISKEIEDAPIGYLKFLYSGEIIDYYSEEKLLRDFKNSVYSQGINAIKYKINKTIEKPRHGLKFELLKEEADEYGVDYTKEEYERSFKKKYIEKKYER